MKIVFFGTSEIGVPILETLQKHFEVAAVVTSPDKPVGRKHILSPSPISNTAERLGIFTYKPEKVKNNSQLLRQLKQHGADIFVVVSYGKILPLELLDIPKLKTVNVHFSILPAYRGPAPVQFALLNGETKTGTTIFILDEQVDHGPILATAEIDIAPDDTNITLQSKLSQLSCDIIVDVLEKYESSQITPTEQNHDLATPSKLISKEDGIVNWNESAQQIYNRFRAYQPWPGIYTTWQGKTLKILACKPEANSNLAPGLTIDGLVGCGNSSALKLLTVQLEGKNPTDIRAFLNGYPNFKSSQLI